MSVADQTVMSTPSRPRHSSGLQKSESFARAKVAVPSMAGFSPGGQVAEGYSYLSRSSSISTSTRSRPQGLQSRSSLDFSSPTIGLSKLPPGPSSIDGPLNCLASPTKLDSEAPQRLPRPVESISARALEIPAGVLARSQSEVETTANAASNLPTNPKLWTYSQVAIYLTHVLGLVPRPVVEDVTSYVRASRMTGRTFLRLSEQELERQGLNLKWRRLMLEAVRKLRRDALRGRIWGNEAGSMRWPRTALEHEIEREDDETFPVEEEVSLDDDEIVKSSKGTSKLTLKRMRNRNKVRGMIQAFQTSPSNDNFDITAPDAMPESGYVKQQASSFGCGDERAKHSLQRPLRSRRSTADFPWLSHIDVDEGGNKKGSDRASNDAGLKISAASSIELDGVDMIPTLRRYGQESSVSGTESSLSECSGTDSDLDPCEHDGESAHQTHFGQLDEGIIRAIMEEQPTNARADGTMELDWSSLQAAKDTEEEEATDSTQLTESDALRPMSTLVFCEEKDQDTLPFLLSSRDNTSKAETSVGYEFESAEVPVEAGVTSLRNKKATFGSKRGKAMLSRLNETNELGNELPSALLGAKTSAAGTVSRRRQRKGTAEDEEGWGGTLGRTTDRASLRNVFAPASAPAIEHKTTASQLLRKQPLARIVSEADDDGVVTTSDAQATFEQLDCDEPSPESPKLVSNDLVQKPEPLIESIGLASPDESAVRLSNTVAQASQPSTQDECSNMLVPLTVLEPHPSGTGSVKKRSMVLVDRKRFESLARRMTQLESQLESLDKASIMTSRNDGVGLREIFAGDDCAQEGIPDSILEESELAENDLDDVGTGSKRWRSYISPSGWVRYLSTLNPYFSTPTPQCPRNSSRSSSDDDCSLAALLGRDESEHEKHMLSIGAIPAYMLGLGAGLGFVLVREVLSKTR